MCIQSNRLIGTGGKNRTPSRFPGYGQLSPRTLAAVVRTGRTMMDRERSSVAASLALAVMVLFSPIAARAQADTASIWTLQEENAAISLQRPRERLYTNGLSVAWTSPTTMVSDALADLGQVLWAGGQTRIGAALSQRIGTTTDTHTANPAPTGQPALCRATGGRVFAAQ